MHAQLTLNAFVCILASELLNQVSWFSKFCKHICIYCIALLCMGSASYAGWYRTIRQAYIQCTLIRSRRWCSSLQNANFKIITRLVLVTTSISDQCVCLCIHTHYVVCITIISLYSSCRMINGFAHEIDCNEDICGQKQERECAISRANWSQRPAS